MKVSIKQDKSKPKIKKILKQVQNDKNFVDELK